MSPVVVRKGPKRAEERAPTAVEMARMAKLFEAVVSAWGGVDAAANFLEINKSNVSRMCSGEKSVAFRHFLALFEGCPDAFLAFAQPLCAQLSLAPPHMVNGPSYGELCIEAMAFLRSEEMLTRLFLDWIKKTKGWTPEHFNEGLRDSK